MTETPENPRARIGGNQPGPLDALTAETAAIKARMLDIRVALLKVPDVVTDETAPLVSDMLLQASKALTRLDKIRISFKKPVDDHADAIHQHCQSIRDLIGTTKSGGLLSKVHARHHAHQLAFEAAEKTRLAEDRARLAGRTDDAYREAGDLSERADAAARAAVTERQRRDAAALADQAHTAREAADQLADRLAETTDDRAHIRGTGSLSYLVDRALGYRVEDASRVPRDYLSVDDKKVKAAIRAGIEIPGIVTVANRDTVVKG